MWLQEAVWIFEDFITRLQILQKPLAEEEFKIIRNSIFKVAVALEVFALNYGKHQMIGANSSVEINSRKLGESEHDYSFGFEIIHYLFSDRHIDRWHNGCFHDLIFFCMGPVDKCCSQIKPVPPSHRPFIFINHSDNGQSLWRLECWKAFKHHLLEDYVRNTKLSSKYNYHIRIMTYFGPT